MHALRSNTLNREEIIKFLVESGANIQAKYANGYSIIDRLIKLDYEREIAIIDEALKTRKKKASSVLLSLLQLSEEIEKKEEREKKAISVPSTRLFSEAFGKKKKEIMEEENQ